MKRKRRGKTYGHFEWYRHTEDNFLIGVRSMFDDTYQVGQTKLEHVRMSIDFFEKFLKLKTKRKQNSSFRFS